VLAVVLALLVLLCAGVISFLLKQGNIQAMGASPPQTVAFAPGVTVVNSSVASYRLGKSVLLGADSTRSVYGSGQSDSLMTEGRQTL
jgi:hypothetical protein